MASFPPIKLCDDDGGGGGVAAMLVYTEQREREQGILPLLINESAARHSGRTLFPLNAIKARASGPDRTMGRYTAATHGDDFRAWLKGEKASSRM